MNPIQRLLTENIGLWTGADTAKKTGRGRASGSADTVYGIKKLRELILELAVRGKLVPQDPSDEPASSLLERIQTERIRLVAEKRIRKGQPFSQIADQEKTFDLPHGWEWVRLGHIGDWGAGATPQRSKSSYYGGKTPWFKSGELTADFIETSEETITDLALQECSLRLNQPGDVLIAMYGATIGKTAILKTLGTTNQAVCACTPNAGIFNIYLLVLLKAMKSNFVAQGTGGAQPNISREKIIATVIALPSTEEQHRIVAKVEELMALCDRLEGGHTDAADAHEKLVSHLLTTLTASQDNTDFSASWQRIAAHFDFLFTTESSIDALKQTMLQLAVMGKLVPQERDDEPASALFDRLAEDAREYSINLKISPPKPEPISVDILQGELPNGWMWARLCSLFRVITDGDHQSPPQAGEGIPFLTIGNITTGSLNFSGCRFVSKDYFDSVARHRKPGFGDILYTVVGATYGRPVLVGTHQEFCVQRHIAILKCSEHINVRFASYLLSSPEIYEQATQCTTGTAQPTIPLRPLRSFLIRLPPIAEQHRIVAKVDELMALCDRMKTRIADASALQRKLADVMVAQAVA